jgi:uncharacterized hydantoinase/oxoprolinase family protein
MPATDLEKQQAEEIRLLKEELEAIPRRLAASIRGYAKKHYAEDLFPPEGKTTEACAARFARTVCEALAEHVEQTH